MTKKNPPIPTSAVANELPGPKQRSLNQSSGTTNSSSSSYNSSSSSDTKKIR